MWLYVFICACVWLCVAVCGCMWLYGGGWRWMDLNEACWMERKKHALKLCSLKAVDGFKERE